MKFYAIGGAVIVSLFAISYVGAPRLTTLEYAPNEELARAGSDAPKNEEKTSVDTRTVVRHVPLPKEVKAAYMTACVAGTRDFRERLIAFVEETELNTLVIDIKDYSGTISFAPTDPILSGAWNAAKCGARDMRSLIEELHDKDIFVIGRVTVFQDPYYAVQHPELAVKRADGVTVWKDHKGLSFIDVGARAYWDYMVALARDSYNLGFDELNFDYVRYPSDGPMTDISFTHSKDYPGDNNKQANLEEFFKYLSEKLADESLYKDYRHENTGRASTTPWTSADLFGMTTTNYDDLSIGQVQDRAAPYFNFIAPMVYPSHYPDGFIGLADPNSDPYAVVHYAMQKGVARMTATTTPMMGFTHTRIGTSTPAVYAKTAYGPEKFRTWIQDFDYGGDYDAADVRAQIQASYDAGVMDFMIWAPSNVYTRAALHAQ
jgi:hypothetical protein